MATVRIGGRAYDVTVRGNVVIVDGTEYPITLREDGAYVTVNAGGVAYRIALPPAGERSGDMSIEVDHRPMNVVIEGSLGGRQAAQPTASPARGATSRSTSPGAVPAQIAGRIISIRIKVGDPVKTGDVLLLLEAMKMENEVKAPTDGVVAEILIREGDRVAEGDTLVVLSTD